MTFTDESLLPICRASDRRLSPLLAVAKDAGATNFMRAMELEVTKRYGYTLQQAWSLTRDEFAKELNWNF
jgi:hypothetical protein